jgi:hypothetical protein
MKSLRLTPSILLVSASIIVLPSIAFACHNVTTATGATLIVCNDPFPPNGHPIGPGQPDYPVITGQPIGPGQPDFPATPTHGLTASSPKPVSVKR